MCLRFQRQKPLREARGKPAAHGLEAKGRSFESGCGSLHRSDSTILQRTGSQVP